MDEGEGNVRADADLFQVNPRDRLFYTIFVKVGQMYSRSIPPWFRTLIEILLLIKAVSLFTMLSYIHYSFSKYPIDCLGDVKNNWPRDGILRLQIIPTNEYLESDNLQPILLGNNTSILHNSTMDFRDLYKKYKDSALLSTSGHSTLDIWYDTLYNLSSYGNSSSLEGNNLWDLSLLQSKLEGLQNQKDVSIIEYSLEYGFLTLSEETRKKLKIPVKVVSLDPTSDQCFGDSLSRLILKRFLGYDDVLMSSVKRIAEVENNQGYMKNCRTGEHFHFVTMWMGRTSYMVALFLMFIFTISISTLLRFCHQQIFIFIVHVLQIMEWNAATAFPAASLFTVILSLVGMEAIMSEFFNDATTSFYVILIVWSADQYDSICCHTTVTQRHWLKFFYLYHFFFYAYHYRFNGQYSSLALATSWFFIQHSMLYFFHNYELPVIENQINRNQPQHNDVYFDDAILMLFDDLGQLPYGGENRQDNNSNNNDTNNISDNNEDVNDDEEAIHDDIDNHINQDDNHVIPFENQEDLSSTASIDSQLINDGNIEANVCLTNIIPSVSDDDLCTASNSKVSDDNGDIVRPKDLNKRIFKQESEDIEVIDLTTFTRISFDEE